MAPPRPQLCSPIQVAELCGFSTNGATQPAGPKRPQIIVVASDLENARHFLNDLTFFLDDSDKSRVALLPDWESLPYDQIEFSSAIATQRLSVLHSLCEPNSKIEVLITTPSSFLMRLPPTEHIHNSKMEIKVGEMLALDGLRDRLSASGYNHTNKVSVPGDFAVRGSIIDFFPLGRLQPIRVDFFDDHIERLRTFSVETQRTTDEMELFSYAATHEFPLDELALATFKQNFVDSFDIDERRSPVYRCILAREFPEGVEYYTSLFFDKTSTIRDYFDDDVQVVYSPQSRTAPNEFQKLVKERYQERRLDPLVPPLPPEKCFAPYPQILESFNPDNAQTPKSASWSQLKVSGDRLKTTANFVLKNKKQKSGQLFIAGGTESGIAPLKRELESRTKAKIAVAKDLTDALGQDSDCMIVAGELQGSYVNREKGWTFIGSESVPKKTASATVKVGRVGNDNDFMPGDLVVHNVHGVGRYVGLEFVEAKGLKQECAKLEYKNGLSLFVSLERIHELKRYDDNDKTEPDVLGGIGFYKSRLKAEKLAHDNAVMLLERHALRATSKAPIIKTNKAFDEFCEAFSFEATDEQNQAVEEILGDLRQPTPMDRILCGDVGFGKTEVAARAIFAACNAGYQAIIMVPTTLLCRQHFQNFQERFKGFGLNIAAISSVENIDRKEIAADLEKGKIDLLVTTHALVRGTYKFKKCGLVVIDEEHRFGVADKEKINNISSSTHCLKMSATPIPRSLAQALGGVIKMSTLSTPLPGRVPVRTLVRPWRDQIVREAIQRELARGGQIFVVHDRISGLEEYAAKIQTFVPQANIAIAHSRIGPTRLRDTIDAMHDKQINVLVSTTIIESGLDIPNANTVIITRADRIGLAQLHQIRGRVGRSNKSAWCLFLYPSEGMPKGNQRRRLQAVESASQLGSGLNLARDDLEIRGAGELLGSRQSGFIEKIGMNMYLDLLNKAIEKLSNDPDDADNYESPEPTADDNRMRFDLGDEALIPEDYIYDPLERLLLYRKFATLEQPAEVYALLEELQDRYGRLPEETENLARNAKLRIKSKKIGVRSIRQQSHSIYFKFEQNAKINPDKIIQIATQNPNRLRIAPQSISVKLESSGAAQTAEWLLKELQE